mgnify:CR=1 FL=1
MEHDDRFRTHSGVDNYDSFVYTIVGYLKTLGATVTVVRNDAIDPSQPGVIDEYDGVLISPGPGAPAESGASEDMIRLCAKLDKPMFGVCLACSARRSVRCHREPRADHHAWQDQFGGAYRR